MLEDARNFCPRHILWTGLQLRLDGLLAAHFLPRLGGREVRQRHGIAADERAPVQGGLQDFAESAEVQLPLLSASLVDHRVAHDRIHVAAQGVCQGLRIDGIALGKDLERGLARLVRGSRSVPHHGRHELGVAPRTLR